SPSRLSSMPSSVTTPLVGRSSPATRLSSVDLPLPDGPMMAVTRPAGIRRETWCKAGSVDLEPYRLVTSESWTSVSITASLLDVGQDCGRAAPGGVVSLEESAYIAGMTRREPNGTRVQAWNGYGPPGETCANCRRSGGTSGWPPSSPSSPSWWATMSGTTAG